MRLKLLVQFVLLCITLSASAQSVSCIYSVSGKVLDVDTQEPIPNAVVKVEGIEKYTTTDIDGNFKIDGLCSATNTLIFSSIGYADSRKEHDHGSDFRFYLKQEVTGLEEVTIEAERAKQKGTKTIAQVTVGKTEIANNPTQSLAAVLSKQQGVTFISR